MGTLKCDIINCNNNAEHLLSKDGKPFTRLCHKHWKELRALYKGLKLSLMPMKTFKRERLLKKIRLKRKNGK